MHHRLSDIATYGLSGLEKEAEHSYAVQWNMAVYLSLPSTFKLFDELKHWSLAVLQIYQEAMKSLWEGYKET